MAFPCFDVKMPVEQGHTYVPKGFRYSAKSDEIPFLFNKGDDMDEQLRRKCRFTFEDCTQHIVPHLIRSFGDRWKRRVRWRILSCYERAPN